MRKTRKQTYHQAHGNHKFGKRGSNQTTMNTATTNSETQRKQADHQEHGNQEHGATAVAISPPHPAVKNMGQKAETITMIFSQSACFPYPIPCRRSHPSKLFYDHNLCRTIHRTASAPVFCQTMLLYLPGSQHCLCWHSRSRLHKRAMPLTSLARCGIDALQVSRPGPRHRAPIVQLD